MRRGLSSSKAKTSSQMSAGAMIERRPAGSGLGLSSGRLGGRTSLAGISDVPSPSKPGSMEDAIRLWLKIGNIEKLQVVSLYMVKSCSPCGAVTRACMHICTHGLIDCQFTEDSSRRGLG